MNSWLKSLCSHRQLFVDDIASAVLRRQGGIATLLECAVRSVRSVSNCHTNDTVTSPSTVLILGDFASSELATSVALQAFLHRNTAHFTVIVRQDQLSRTQAALEGLTVHGVPLALICVAKDVTSSLWTLSSDLHCMAEAVAQHVGARGACFGVGRAGKIAASYCARMQHIIQHTHQHNQQQHQVANVAVVFVARDLDCVPLFGAVGDSLYDSLRDIISFSDVPIDDEDASPFVDDVLCSSSLPFRSALVQGTQQAVFECVQHSLLDSLPPEHIPALAGALTLAKVKKAAQLLVNTSHHVLRLELAFLLLALAPQAKRVARRRESALRVALALAVTDNFVAGVNQLEANATERVDKGGEWTDAELRSLVRAFVSALGQAPAVAAIERMFGTADADQFHGELERIASARSNELRRHNGVLVAGTNNEYTPFVRRLATQLFVERQVDDERDCVHVQADDEVLGADYGSLPAAPQTKSKSLGLGLLGGVTRAHKTRVSDFSTVYIVICGVAGASEVREIQEQVAISSLAKSLNVTVVSAMPPPMPPPTIHSK